MESGSRLHCEGRALHVQSRVSGHHPPAQASTSTSAAASAPPHSHQLGHTVSVGGRHREQCCSGVERRHDAVEGIQIESTAPMDQMQSTASSMALDVVDCIWVVHGNQRRSVRCTYSENRPRGKVHADHRFARQLRNLGLGLTGTSRNMVAMASIRNKCTFLSAVYALCAKRGGLTPGL